jgi:hypothetical protein
MIPRRRTLQGGFGRATLDDGQPNIRAQGTMQQYLGSNPVGREGPGGIQSFLPPKLGGTRTGGITKGGITKGFGATDQMGGISRRRLPPGGPLGGKKRKGKGKGGGVGGGRQNILKKMGMPLDPIYEMDRRQARDSLQAAMTQLQNQRQVGLAGLAEEELLGNRNIDENMASRGLYGSGIERRDERLLGNDIAESKMGLLSDFTSGRTGSQMDFRRQMQDALMDLARRQQGNKYLPLPKGKRGRRGKPKKKGGRRPPPGGPVRR